MMTPFDLDWGNLRDLQREDMVSVEILPGRSVSVRNRDVGAVMAELVRRSRADGWDGPDQTLDEWGYARRLKRWAEALGHQLATARCRSGRTTPGAPLSTWTPRSTRCSR